MRNDSRQARERRNRETHRETPGIEAAMTQVVEDLTITDRALEKILETARNEGISFDSTLLRVAVVPGGCSGLTYDLGWDTTLQEGDRVMERGGIRVVLDRRSYLYVQGSELDFTSGLDGRGFHFLNPQAARTCACGESFGL